MVKLARKLTSGKAKPSKRSTVPETSDLKRSKLEIWDIPIALIDDSPENPQEMDDATFDELVEGIRQEGVDEPLHVVRVYGDDGEWTGRYMLTSGHHRKKGAKVAGLTEVPCVIKEDVDDAYRKIALVRRNQLRGKINSKKFSQLFREVAPVLGAETAKRLMGFTKKDAFNRVYEEIASSLPAEARKKMVEAKETVRSVDDLSSVLNNIFKEEGSKAHKSYMVFSYGGKKHFYFTIEKGMVAELEKAQKTMDTTGKTATEFFLPILRGDLTVADKPAPKKRLKRRAK